ncbi:hypothetical protein [Chromobacterium sp. Beijing]|uniref:hypothetical protein n=1 Tax=Chromobacterium sp. Beijing TaxID=2735795 RepID=UPI001F37AE2A|nr:hypothetical protein [Chromobacterium sp. Beijing]UJB33595.1 hypothetical protein HQN78_22520 [Chromobacterium sp. Beijing]
MSETNRYSPQATRQGGGEKSGRNAKIKADKFNTWDEKPLRPTVFNCRHQHITAGGQSLPGIGQIEIGIRQNGVDECAPHIHHFFQRNLPRLTGVNPEGFRTADIRSGNATTIAPQRTDLELFQCRNMSR